MPTLYPVDYTGTALPNKIVNEPRSISAANFRNYKVIIPEFTPFHVNGLVITHPATNYTLIEDQDYFLTHLYVEASKSIGHDIYGSISITSNLTGVFEVTYQTVGGEWTLPANTIANILANLAINPRTARWTQVALYPAVFPTVNHATDVEDMTGMTEVVQAIDALGVILEDQQQLGGISDPYANITEAKAGIAANRVMSPATTFAAIQDSLSDFRLELNGGDVDAGLTAFNKDFFGEVSFINDAYKVVYENAEYNSLKGLAYVEGLRNETLLDIPVDTGGSLEDVWLESYYSAATGDVEHVVDTTSAELITNYAQYSSNLGATAWTSTQNNVISTSVIAPNAGYNSKNKKLLGRLTMVDNQTVVRLQLPNNALTVGSTYLVSFYARRVSGNAALTVKLGLGGDSAMVTIDGTLNRYSMPLVYTNHNQLSFRLADAGILELGDVQIENTASRLMVANPEALASAPWVLSDAIVTSAISGGPWTTGSSANKLTETTANSEHSLSGTFYCAVGARYKVSFIAKEVERSVIDITTSGNGVASGTSRIDLSTITVTTADPAHKQVTVTELTEGVALAGFKLVEFYIYGEVGDYATVSIKLTNGSSSYIGVSGSGILLTSVSIIANSLWDFNLLEGNDSLHYPIWTKSGSQIDRRRFKDVNENETAFKLVESLGSGEHYLTKSFPALADKDYVFSIFVKAAERNRIRISLTGGTGGVSYTINLLDIQTATTAITGAGWSLPAGTVSILDEGWFRISIKGHSDLSAAHYPIQAKISVLDDTGADSYIGDGIAGILIYYPMVQVGTIYSNSPQVTYINKPNDLITTYATSLSSYKAKARESWYDSMGNYHRYVKLATIVSNSSIKDWREVVYVNTTLADRSTKTYRPVVDGVDLKPDNYYWLKSGQVALLPSTQGLNEGAAFYFEKALGVSASVAVADAGNDLIFAYDYNQQTLISDTSYAYDTTDELKIIFNGTDYEVRF